MKVRTFADSVTAYVSGGRGGNGCVSFRREKYIPRGGPSGGDGGRGGSVILRADKNTDSLISLQFSPHRRAGDGEHGRGKDQYGKRGLDVLVNVPCGTEVWDKESGELLADMVNHGEEFTAAAGGRGGLGNIHWASSTHQAPREHTDGLPGEERTLMLELKLMAEVGTVGYPNAGKSSLLAAISNAKPKIASYPFTTLNPIVGTVTYEDYHSLTVADIPGLVDGAHDGIGLGHAFLRHIERSSALMFVLDMAGVDGRNPIDDYRSLLRELKLHRSDLVKRRAIIVANKMDLPEARANFRAFVKRTHKRPLQVSALQRTGIEQLRAALRRLVQDKR